MFASAGEVLGIVIVAALAGVGVVALFASRVHQDRPAGERRRRQATGGVQVGRPAGHAHPRALHRQDGEGRRARVPHDGRPAGRHHQGQRVAAGERDHLLPGDRRQVGAVRDQRLPAGGRPALPHGAAGRLRRALARPGAVRARDDQQPHAGPHGRRHGQVGRAAQPDRDPRHHPAHERGAGDVRAEGGRAAQARRRSRSPRASSRRPSTAPAGASRPPCSRPRAPSSRPSCGPRPR